MNARTVQALDRRLTRFLADIIPLLGRRDRGPLAQHYLTGLLLDGERKSVQPMAARLGLDEQALSQFLNQSPWDHDPVQAALVAKVARACPQPTAWIIDEVALPKQGTHSVGVQRQYCGTLGKVANCQVAVSLHAAGTARFSCPAGWRLYLPAAWVEDPARCARAHVPPEAIRARTKNELALDLVDEALARGLPRAPVSADAAYGGDYAWREALRARGLSYVVSTHVETKVWTEDPTGLAHAERPPTYGLRELAPSLPAKAWRHSTWRQGTRGPMRSRFALVAVWAAHGARGGRVPRTRVREWLLIEWPKGEAAPTQYWLGCFADGHTPTRQELITLAHGRWRVEQDYRELKDELGLDHYEGRHWPGWHHQVTLASLALLFLRLAQTQAAQKKSTRAVDAAAGAPAPASGAHPLAGPLPLVRHTPAPRF